MPKKLPKKKLECDPPLERIELKRVFKIEADENIRRIVSDISGLMKLIALSFFI